MIALKLLTQKYTVAKDNGDIIPDLTRSSIDKNRFKETNYKRTFVVDEFTAMRPDLISYSMYVDQNKCDMLMKYNGISNPFAIQEGDIIFIPDSEDLRKIYQLPNEIKDISDVDIDTVENVFIDPKTFQDEKRLKMLKKKNKGKEILPSNVNKKGDKNIKIKDGKIVFGEDVTSINKQDCPEPISRANLKKALIKNNLFG